MVELCDAAAAETKRGPEVSSRALEARKRTADEDAAREEEAKWARVEQCLEVLQAASLQVADMKQREGGLEERARPEARSEARSKTASATDPPIGQEGAVRSSLTKGADRGIP
jgi:hypothetical protein